MLIKTVAGTDYTKYVPSRFFRQTEKSVPRCAVTPGEAGNYL